MRLLSVVFASLALVSVTVANASSLARKQERCVKEGDLCTEADDGRDDCCPGFTCKAQEVIVSLILRHPFEVFESNIFNLQAGALGDDVCQ